MEKEEKLHTIRRIRYASEIEEEVPAALLGTAGMAGFFGIGALNTVLFEGMEALQNNTGLLAFSAISGSLLVIWLGIFIKEKIASHAAVQKIREESGMTKEMQKEILESLVAEGNNDAIALFDFFYGERRRKAL